MSHIIWLKNTDFNQNLVARHVENGNNSKAQALQEHHKTEIEISNQESFRRWRQEIVSQQLENKNIGIVYKKSNWVINGTIRLSPLEILERLFMVFQEIWWRTMLIVTIFCRLNFNQVLCLKNDTRHKINSDELNRTKVWTSVFSNGNCIFNRKISNSLYFKKFLQALLFVFECNAKFLKCFSLNFIDKARRWNF